MVYEDSNGAKNQVRMLPHGIFDFLSDVMLGGLHSGEFENRSLDPQLRLREVYRVIWNAALLAPWQTDSEKTDRDFDVFAH